MDRNTADISVVAMLKDRDIYRVRNLLWTMYYQEMTPDKVIIVDQTVDQIAQDCCRLACEDYGATYVPIPQEEFSMPKAFNTGLSLVDTEYVMFTGIDMMFSKNFISVLMDKISPSTMVNAIMGYYPKIFFIGNDDFYSRWEEIIGLCDPAQITRALSPGACQAMSTSWLRGINGYDERYSGGLGGIDDELRTRAHKSGVYVKWIEWDEAQVVHLWHPRSPLKDKTSHLFDANPPIVANTGGME